MRRRHGLDEGRRPQGRVEGKYQERTSGTLVHGACDSMRPEKKVDNGQYSQDTGQNTLLYYVYSLRLGLISFNEQKNSVSKPLTEVGGHVGNIYTFLIEDHVADV